MALDPTPPSARGRRSYRMPNTPGFNSVFSIDPQPSPAFSMTPLRPLGEETDGRTSTTPTQESLEKNERANYRPSRLLRWGRIAVTVSRIAISTLLVAAGAAIVGCEGHALHTYNATNLSDQWFLPLWPQHFDLRPTVTILAAGAIILGLNLVYLVFACIPYCFHRPSLHNALHLTLTSLCFVAAVVATAYSAHLYSSSNGTGNSRDTILSWTCRWADGASADSVTSAAGTASVGDNGGITAPTGFAKLCWESHAAFDLVAVTVFFEVVALALGGIGAWVERRL